MLSIRDNEDLWLSSRSMILASLFCFSIQFARNMSEVLGLVMILLTRASSSENVKTACVRDVTRCSTLIKVMRCLDSGFILQRSF
jgi:hypothetical protein